MRVQSKIIFASIVFSIAFYLGNIAPVKLPRPGEVKMYFEKEKAQDYSKTPEFQIHTFEKYMIELVNEQRELHGLSKLKYGNQNLFLAARQHSSEMIELDYFSHTSPVKKYETLTDRLNLVGEEAFMKAGENISFVPCCGHCDKRFVEASMFGGKLKQNNCYIEGKGLMNSPGHRANILDPEFEFIGIGIITGKYKESYGIWVTQVFVRY